MATPRRYPRRGWEPEAIEWLTAHAERMRFSALVDRFRTVAEEQGWRYRTDAAIKIQISKLGLSTTRAVVCLETGTIYPSAKVAAKAVGRKVESLRAAIRGGLTCGGYRWAYVDVIEECSVLNEDS